MTSTCQLNGRMGMAIPSRSVISIVTVSSVAAIVECQGPIMGNMHIRPNVPSVALSMEQTVLTCTRGGAPSVDMVPLESGTGRPRRRWFQLCKTGIARNRKVAIVARSKRKLSPAEKAEKKKRRKEYMTIFVNGRQKRIKRPPTIDSMDADEFIRRNADPIWLHQNEMWEYMTGDDESEES